MKPLCVIQAPVATRSGYGDMARTICNHVIDMNKYEVKVISTPWGACPMDALDNAADEVELKKRVHNPPIHLSRQPDLFIQITVPSEFKPIGKYNIGITAGIETTTCSMQWLEGCNRMDLILTISEHSKTVFMNTFAEMKDQAGNTVNKITINKPVEVLHNCVDDIFYPENAPTSDNVDQTMLDIKEKYAFLFVGHWIKGDFGHDRKNIGKLIQYFCETFRNVSSMNRPALVLKTSGAIFSLVERERILGMIQDIKDTVGPNCPNVYVLYGNMTQEEMSALMNHPKIKAHISLTHGEGFGRPLLEGSVTEKPVIASGWSGVLDFLNKDDALLVGGGLQQLHHSAVWENVLIPESAWFIPDEHQARGILLHAFNNYDKLLPGAKRLAAENRKKFSYDAIFERTKAIFDQYVPKFEVETGVKLPTLKKLK